MGLLHEADAWVAKKLFFPVIIAVCRRTGVSQYAFASYATVLSLLCIVPLVMEDGADANRFFQLILLAMVGTLLAYHAMRPELVRPSRGIWRGVGWAMVAFNLIELAIGDFRAYALAMWLSLLAAEYALLIDRIPPEARKRHRRAAEAHSRGN